MHEALFEPGIVAGPVRRGHDVDGIQTPSVARQRVGGVQN
jgi:hypothetical protein